MDYDDQPVGQHKDLEVSEQPPEITESSASTLPLSERLLSKNTRTRFEAACELLKEISTGSNSDEHYLIIQKLISDPHPGVQEKALDSLLLLLAANPPSVTDNELIKIVIEKCLTSSKTSIKSKATECILMIAEFANTQNLIYDTIKEYLSTKTTSAKLAAASLSLLEQLLSNFGNSIFAVNEVLELVVTQAGSTNALVKSETMNYLREAHRWVKDSMMTAFEVLKPLQQEGLKKCFAEETASPVPKRVVKEANTKVKDRSRSSKTIDKESSVIKESPNKKAVLDANKPITGKDEVKTIIANEEEKNCVDKRIAEKADIGRTDSTISNEKKVEALDKETIADINNEPSAKMSEKNVILGIEADANADEVCMAKIDTSGIILLSQFNEDWCNSLIRIKKKMEKRDKLEELLNAVTICQVKNDGGDELEKMLKKLLNDSSIMVVNVAMKIIGKLSELLKDQFEPFARSVFLTILQKCKDKKTVIESQKCLENLIHSLKLVDMLDDIKEALGDKSPQVKARIVYWLEVVVIPSASKELLSNWGKELAPILIKLADDALGEVRDSALSCLGVLKGLLNDNSLDEMIKEVNSKKQEKIMKSAGGIGKDNVLAQKIDNMEDTKGDIEPGNKYSLTCNELKKKSEGRKESKKGNIIKKTAMKEIKMEDVGEIISKEEAEKVVTERLSTEITSEFDKAEWKEKKKRLHDLSEWIKSNSPLNETFTEALAVWLNIKLKNFKENNINVLKEGFDVLKNVAALSILTKRFAMVIVPGIMEKVADIKLFELCEELILLISDSASPGFTSSLIIQLSYSIKSVNWIKNSLNLLNKMIEEYTAKLMPVMIILDYTKHCLEHVNIQVRELATKTILAMYSQLGIIIKPLIAADLKDTVYKSFEAEFSKIKPITIQLKRKLKGIAEIEAKKKSKEACNNVVPKANISSQLTSKLISDLTHPSMKVRQEAKDTLEQILVTTNNHIQSVGLNSLTTALVSRMNEPCKNLAKGFITLVGNIALALGPECKQFCKTLLQPLMRNLGDKQASIRAETVIAIDKFAEIMGPAAVINIIGAMMEKDNPELRTEVLAWILKNNEALGKVDAESLVKPLIIVLQDRSKEIRILAEQVVEIVMRYVEYQSFIKAIQDFKPIVKIVLEATLEKYRSTTQRHDEDTKVCGDKSEVTEFNKDDTSKVAEDKKGNIEEENELKKSNTTVPPINNYIESDTEAEVQDNVKENVVSIETEKEDIKLTEKTHKPNSVKKKTGERFRKNSESEAKHENKERPKKFESEKFQQKTLQAVKSAAKKRVELERSAKTTKKLTPTIPKMHSTNFSPLINSVSSIDLPNTNTIRQVVSKDSFNRTPSKSQLSANTSIETVGNLSVEAVILNALGNKERRAEADKGMKWPIYEIRNDYVDKLKKALKSVMHPTVFEYMFSRDVKKNLEVIRVLRDSISFDISLVKDVLDLLFKWVTIKIIGQGTSIITKQILEYLSILFNELKNCDYILMDFEADAILPILCDRLGTSNEVLKTAYKALIKGISEIYSASKICNSLIVTLDSKNQKTKAEALMLIKDILRIEGANAISSKDIRIIAKLVAVGDNSIKNEAIDCLIELYKYKGKKLWNMIGDLPEKSKGILKAKFDQILLPKTISDDASPLGNSRTTEANFAEDKKLSQEESRKRPVDIDDYLKRLNNGEDACKLDTLTSLDDMIKRLTEENREELIKRANDIFQVFVNMLKFFAANDIALKFKTYLLNMLQDLCSQDYLLKQLTEHTLVLLLEQIMESLLLDKAEEAWLDSLMSILNEIIEESDPNRVFNALFEIFKNYKEDLSIPGDSNLSKVAELIIKSLKKFSKRISASLSCLNVSLVLLKMHEFLSEEIKGTEFSTQYEIIGVRLIKTILKDLVRNQKEEIWTSYKVLEVHQIPDQHLKRWIDIILGSCGQNDSAEELRDIFKGLQSEATFNAVIVQLHEYMLTHPKTNLKQYLAPCTARFRESIISALKKCARNSKEKAELEEYELMIEEEKSETNNNEDSLAEYKKKMEMLSQKLGIAQVEDKEPGKARATKSKDSATKANKHKAIVHGGLNGQLKKDNVHV